ncbi:MAG: acetyltransferase [Prochloraceae cyanobacterium]|nr:acetyltransferase [Prochloraceae cyanobacterium]
MFLLHKRSGDLVEILTPEQLYDPCQRKLSGRFHCGEEMQDIEIFAKSEMAFPSGESLPICWLDPHYREKIA